MRRSTASSSTRPSAASAAATSGSRTIRASPCTTPTPGRFSARTDERYDLIVVDAYHQPYVPFYLATREFFRLVRERLAPGGIVALNVAAVPGDRRLVRGIGRTVAAELPQVLEWPALRFNTLVLGLTEPLARTELERRLANGPPRSGAAAGAARAGRPPARGVAAARGRTTARRSSGSPTG